MYEGTVNETIFISGIKTDTYINNTEKENSEINSHSNQMTFNKSIKNTHWRKESLVNSWKTEYAYKQE